MRSVAFGGTHPVDVGQLQHVCCAEVEVGDARALCTLLVLSSSSNSSGSSSCSSNRSSSSGSTFGYWPLGTALRSDRIFWCCVLILHCLAFVSRALCIALLDVFVGLTCKSTEFEVRLTLPQVFGCYGKRCHPHTQAETIFKLHHCHQIGRRQFHFLQATSVSNSSALYKVPAI